MYVNVHEKCKFLEQSSLQGSFCSKGNFSFPHQVQIWFAKLRIWMRMHALGGFWCSVYCRPYVRSVHKNNFIARDMYSYYIKNVVGSFYLTSKKHKKKKKHAYSALQIKPTFWPFMK